MTIWQTVGFVVKGYPEASAGAIDAYYDENGIIHYDVYLPWDQEKELQVVCDRDVRVTIDGNVYFDGDSFAAPALTELEGEIDIPDVGIEKGQFRFIGTYGIPSVHLGLYDESKEFLTAAKGNTASGFCAVLKNGGAQDFVGNCSIRVHGNTSWYNDKKSYQFNLEYDSEILGLSQQSNWLLVSEGADSSYMKNAIMYELSKRTGDEYAPDFRFVNVYLDGRYEGLYMLVQKIDIGGTLDINDLEAANNVMRGQAVAQDITGGYLVELAVQQVVEENDERLRLETPHRWMRIKAPNNITDAQYDYLSKLVNKAENALYLSDGETDEEGKTWSDYYDSESWLRQYVLQEISANYDTEFASEFFYVKEGDPLLHGGPAWDFDRSITDYIVFVQNESMKYFVNRLHNNAITIKEKDESGIMWLHALDLHEDFHEQMKSYYIDVAEPELRTILDEEVPKWQEEIADSVATDMIKWRREGGFEDKVSGIVDAFNSRMDFLHEYYLHEEDYCLLTFVLDESRIDVMFPVKEGTAIDGALPMYKDDMDWYNGDKLFTSDDIVTEDMILTKTPQ